MSPEEPDEEPWRHRSCCGVLAEEDDGDEDEDWRPLRVEIDVDEGIKFDGFISVVNSTLCNPADNELSSLRFNSQDVVIIALSFFSKDTPD